MIKRIQDFLLAYLQKHCNHPSRMVAIDIAEGSFEKRVEFCRRCGAVRFEVHWELSETPWRLPDPNLWRG